MKFLKTLLVAIAISVAAHRSMAQAPIYVAPAAQWQFGTNSLAASGGATAGTNLWLLMDVRKQANIGVTLTANSVGATNVAVVFSFARSLVGTTNTFETTLQTVTVTSALSTQSVVLTNLNTWGCGYIALVSVSNSTANCSATNLSAVWPNKISAP